MQLQLMKSPTRISIHEDPGMISNMSGDDLLNEMGDFGTFQETPLEFNEDLLQFIHTIALTLEQRAKKK